MLEIRNMLDNLGIEYKENKSNAIMTLSNGSTISFTPLDDDRKIRSLNLDYIFASHYSQFLAGVEFHCFSRCVCYCLNTGRIAGRVVNNKSTASSVRDCVRLRAFENHDFRA